MAPQAIVLPPPARTARPRKQVAPVLPATTPTSPRAAARATKSMVTRETSRVKATASNQARQVKGTAVGQSKVVARTAERDVRDLAETVRSQADQVKGEFTGQVRELLAETEGQLQQQADVQVRRVAATLAQVGNQAVALSEGRTDQAGPLVEYAEQAADWLDNVASHIEERGIEGLATDVVDFARRRPALFLAGAAVVGFGVGRLIRSGAVSGDDNEEA